MPNFQETAQLSKLLTLIEIEPIIFAFMLIYPPNRCLYIFCEIYLSDLYMKIICSNSSKHTIDYSNARSNLYVESMNQRTLVTRNVFYCQ